MKERQEEKPTAVFGSFRNIRTPTSEVIVGHICALRYEFRPSLATPILFLVDVRRDVPFFYDTFLVQIVADVATPDQALAAPWWSAALAHTNAYDPTTSHPSAHISPPHHG